MPEIMHAVYILGCHVGSRGSQGQSTNCHRALSLAGSSHVQPGRRRAPGAENVLEPCEQVLREEAVKESRNVTLGILPSKMFHDSGTKAKKREEER